jgi:hypothetical protein
MAQAADTRPPEQPKKPYTPPRLVRHGTVEELTKGSPGNPLQTDTQSHIP